jgi:hypothetical protein
LGNPDPNPILTPKQTEKNQPDRRYCSIGSKGVVLKPDVLILKEITGILSV